MSPVRKPAVAGQFYPGLREELDETVRSLSGPGPAHEALGVMVPHAGYMYSGRVAGAVYASVELPQHFIILGPNHTGLGPPASIMPAGVWEMPGGDASIDSGLAESIMGHSSVLEADESAHMFEHSIEVQLPFLQVLAGEISFVPICLMTKSVPDCRDVGRAIAAAIRSSSEAVLVVASSDMSHYERQDIAQQKDGLALDQLRKRDPDGLLDTVSSNDITMCGVAPAATMLYACNELGATKANVVGYQTSGDVTGDLSQVVGYAGVVVS